MVTQLLLCRSPARGRPLRPRQPRPGPRLGRLQRHRGRLATGPRSHILITVDIKRYIDNGACLRRPPRLWRGWGCPVSTRASPAAACSPSARTRTAGTLTASSGTSGEVSWKHREISLTALMCNCVVVQTAGGGVPHGGPGGQQPPAGGHRADSLAPVLYTLLRSCSDQYNLYYLY